MGVIADMSPPVRKNRQEKMRCSVAEWAAVALDAADVAVIEAWFEGGYNASTVYEHLETSLGGVPFTRDIFQRHRGQRCACKQLEPLQRSAD